MINKAILMSCVVCVGVSSTLVAQVTRPSSPRELQRSLQRELDQARKYVEELQDKIETAGDDAPPKVLLDARRKVERLEKDLADAHLQLRVFRLRHVKAADAAELLHQVLLDLEGFRVAVDERLNSLVVQVPRSGIDLVSQLIEAVDQAKESRETERSFTLPTRTAALQFVDQLKGFKMIKSWKLKAIGGKTEVTAVIPATAKVELVEKVFTELEEQYVTRTRQVRVVWLVSDLPDSTELPEGLLPVIKELDRLGIKKMSVAAQTSVRTLDQFSLVCLAELESGGTAVELEVEGAFVGDRLDISLHAAQGDRNLARISTSIVAPPNHPVVLGVSPVQSHQSAFVITVN